MTTTRATSRTGHTAASPRPTRTYRVHWTATPLDRTVASVSVTDRGRTDRYHVFHECDSCEVEWVHDDDDARRYTVTCSADGGNPIWCTCPARSRCRHMAATASMVERGQLAMPRVAGDAGREWDEREVEAMLDAMAATGLGR